MSKNALIIFVKNPIEGQVKTRLAKTIGNDAAVAVYKQLLHHTFLITKDFTVDKFVFYGDYVNDTDVWPSAIYRKQLQKGYDLGERMKNAFDFVLQLGYEKAVIIGSDCYELTTKILQEAFDSLSNQNAVIGPCADGGYYLLGMKVLEPKFFSDIQWSTDSVFMLTIAVFNKLELTYSALQVLNDVDDEASLPKELRQFI